MNFGTFLLSGFRNPVLWVSVATFLIAQVCKFVLTAITKHTLVPERLKGDGGMPSAHSATVMALGTMVGYVSGLGSVDFALSMILAGVVMHDALGVRREVGRHSVNISDLYEKAEDEPKEKMTTFVGHKMSEVVVGAVLGVAVAVIYIVLFMAPTEAYHGYAHLL